MFCVLYWSSAMYPWRMSSEVSCGKSITSTDISSDYPFIPSSSLSLSTYSAEAPTAIQGKGWLFPWLQSRIVLTGDILILAACCFRRDCLFSWGVAPPLICTVDLFFRICAWFDPRDGATTLRMPLGPIGNVMLKLKWAIRSSAIRFRSVLSMVVLRELSSRGMGRDDVSHTISFSWEPLYGVELMMPLIKKLGDMSWRDDGFTRKKFFVALTPSFLNFIFPENYWAFATSLLSERYPRDDCWTVSVSCT
jgi:hypothetical protein